MRRVGVGILALLSALYLLNPTLGVFELLPDNLPVVGNIDEGLACYVLYSCVEYWRGKSIGLFREWKR